MTATISNYVNGTPSSATGDDDNHIRQAYSNGLRTKYWVDLDGDGTEDSDDQVTTYTYGVSKGVSAGDSLIAAGNLLQKVTYPDSSGGSDVVTYAYDTGRMQTWRKDQMGTVIETSYDSGGRREHERVTTFGTGIDQAVKRITWAYDSHGRVATTTTYDNATPGSGSAVNQVQSAWDGWGNLTSFTVDPDGTVGAGGVPAKAVGYAYATATDGRNTIRRSSVTLPGSWTLTYEYPIGSANAYANEASRVATVKTSSHLQLVDYAYLGFGNVVGIEYGEPDVYQRRYGSTSGTWPDLDRFGRVTKSRWTKDLATDMDFFSLDVSYDESSNPLTTEDNIYAAGFDVKYAVDGLDRLTDADEGTLSGGSITSRTRRQQWTTLSQTGNWDRSKLDLNGDGAWGGTNEYDDTRTHNTVNEILTRDTDSNSSANYTLSHDAAGNLTDDGKDYTYVYDAWYRLRQIKNRSSGNVVSEHQYYGNGFRAGEHYDSDADADVDSSDKWFWFAYDERWRIVGTFRDTDSSPKERFLHHTAGAGGYGSSSYIDDLALRERDANTDWNGTAGDGTLEERLYYCQNWRHDVVALVTSGGLLRERVRYFSFGIPFGIPLGDCDGDGDTDSADQSILLGAWGTNTPKCDLNLDGTVDGTDQSIQLGESGATAGWEKLSRNRNRFGYAEYAADMAVNADSHVRHRALLSGLGRWAQRDPLGYRGHDSLYDSVANAPIRAIDPMGLDDVPSAPGAGIASPSEYKPPQSDEPAPPATCKVELCCKGIVGMPGDHCFLKCDKGNGNIQACRGGPTIDPGFSDSWSPGDGPAAPNPPRCFGTPGAPKNPIDTVCAPYDSDYPDWPAQGQTIECITLDSLDCTFCDCMVQAMKDIEDCCKPYAWNVTNSNTVISATIKKCAPAMPLPLPPHAGSWPYAQQWGAEGLNRCLGIYDPIEW